MVQGARASTTQEPLTKPAGRDSSRETRLRQRIDKLTDQRDAAIDLAVAYRMRVDELEEQLAAAEAARPPIHLPSALRDARAARETWKKRAQDAERMLNQTHQARRKRARA